MPNKTPLTAAEKKDIMTGVMYELRQSDEIMAQFPDQNFGYEQIPPGFRLEFAQMMAAESIRDHEVNESDIVNLLGNNRGITPQVALAMAYKILMSSVIKVKMHRKYNQYHENT